MAKKERNIRNTIKEINELLNLCLASSKIKKLIVEEPKGKYEMRPTIHLLLQSPIGSCKSTILSHIASEFKTSVLTEISQAGLVGTIDGQTKQIIPAKAWECRNSLLLIDEFNINLTNWNVFLQLLEQQTWNKKFGMYSSAQSMEDDELFFRVKDGTIDIKTRFSCIVATMKNFKFARGQNFRAFITRLIPYCFKFDIEDLKYILKGNKLFKNLNLKTIPEVIVKKKDYLKIMNFVEQSFNKRDNSDLFNQELFARTVCDLVRIFAVKQKHDIKLYEKIIDWKFLAYNQIGEYYKTNGKKSDIKDN